jgi:hypothetical protein
LKKLNNLKAYKKGGKYCDTTANLP